MRNRKLLSLFVLFITFFSNAQNFQWIKQIGGNNYDYEPRCKLLENGQSIVAWFYSNSTKIDSFSKKNQRNPFIVSLLDKNGKAKWIWTPDSSSGFIYANNILYSERLSKIYVCGNFYKNVTINGALYNGNKGGFIMRLDTNGVFEKIFTLSDTASLSFETIDINSKDELFLGIVYDNQSIPKTQLSIPTLNFVIKKRGCFVIKFSKDLNPLKVSEPAYGYRWGHSCLSISKNNSILYAYTFRDTLSLGFQKYFTGINRNTAYLTTLDSNLKIVRNEELYTTSENGDPGANYTSVNSIKSFEDGSFAVAGIFTDSISISNKRFNKGSAIAFLANYNSNCKLKWIKIPRTKNTDEITSQIIDINFTKDFIYAGGYFKGNTIFDDFNLPDSLGLFWFFKTDRLGNILWMNKIGPSHAYKYISNISVNKKQEVLLSGSIVDTIKINKIEFISKGAGDILLMKINDIEILRGFVNPGPYCAGDTIKIPYTKNGTFNTGNQFIAQLSDEEGNFTGKERELGRLTSTEDGLIKGLLPLFDVVSSPSYRIRIISTNPVVQSYYKYDTLRLLIYSKDTANAGKDTTICEGQTVKLTTTGGSRWRWSPGQFVKDSTANSTLAMPDVTTKYRIIISDSSGCGKIDTAYKTITVWPPLRVLGISTDLVICKNSRTNLKIIPSGGLSTNYNFQWLTSKNGLLRTTDTISIKMDSVSSLKAVLSDGCSAKNDTLEITFSLPDFPFTQLLKDTLVCQNSQPLLKLIPSTGLNTNFTFQWLDLSNQLLRNTDTMSYKVSKNEMLKGVLTYTCSGQTDTSLIKLNVPQPIQAKIEKPGCFTSSLTLKINSSGGYINSLTNQWYRDNTAIGTGETINLTGINKKQKIAVITSDFCQTKIKDSIFIFPNPTAKLVSNADSICQNHTITFFNLSNSFAPLVTKLNWLTNQKTWKNKDTVLTFSETGNQKIKIEITDSLGCSASDEINIMVLENPNAEFVTIPESPTVDHGSFELIPIETSYKKYNWTIGSLTLNHNTWQKVRLPISDTISYLTSLIVSNYFGCTDTVIKNIRIGVSDAFYIPNAVSRNDDGLNDEFAPYGWKILSYDMLIVARTNNVVFKGSTPWKPTFEFGAYSYIIKVKFKDGTENSFKGHVHVIN